MLTRTKLISKKYALLSAFGVLSGLSLILALGLDAQSTTATILGTVTDTSGAVVAGAKLSVKNVQTDVTQDVATDSQGRFRVPELQIGEYEVQAAQTGFQTVLRKGVTLTVGSEAVVDFSLPVGQSQQTVTVEAEALRVETTSSAVSTLVEQTQMRDLPLNGRNFEQLLSLAPGVQALPSQGGSFYGNQQNYSIAGSRPEGQVFLIDNTNFAGFFGHGTGSGATGSSLGIESIAEFQVLTNTYSAQFGGNGAVINAVTRSGSNSFHGSAYEFLRNSALDARNFFDTYRKPGASSADVPAFRRNQYGGSIGGPIRRDKAFFFVNYEGLRQNLGQTSIANVPDANAHLGYLPCATAGAAYPCNTSTGLAFVGVAPSVASTLALFPSATNPTGNGIGTYASVGNVVTHEDYLVARFDYTFSSKDSLFVRYTRDRASVVNPFSGSSLGLELEKDQTANDFATIEEKRVISPNLVNLVRFSFVRPTESADTTSPSLAPLRFFSGRPDGRVNVTGLTNIGPFMLLPYNLVPNHFVEGDDIIWTHGSHSVKAGMSVERVQDNTSSPSPLGGTFAFQSLLLFLQGTAAQVTGPLNGQTDGTRDVRELLLTPYVQDEWKVTQHLTLNMGLRYDFATNPTERRNRLSNVVDFQNGMSFVNVPNIFQKNPTTRNWAPRFGFAYDPFADHKTSIRGGFGIFYDVMTGHVFLPAYWLSPPFANSTQLFPTYPFPFVGAGTTTPKPSAAQGLFYGTDSTPYQMQYNVNIQRELGGGAVLTVGYVGSRGVHLLNTRDYNPPIPTVNSAGQPLYATLVGGKITTNARVDQAFAQLDERTTAANSNYNGLLVGLNRRFTNHLQTQVSYTYSKSLDNASAGQGAENAGGSQVSESPSNTRIDYGRSSFDRTHSLRVSGVYELPFQKNLLVQGWRFSGLFSASTGSPFTILTGFDQAGLGSGNTQRPNLNAGQSGNPILGTPTRWFDPTVFSLPAVGTYGNLGRSTAVGPGLANLDFALSKNTPVRKLSEVAAVEFRAEVFNLLNRANFGLPNNSVFTQAANGGANINPTAGQITSTVTTSRQIQFGLKLLF